MRELRMRMRAVDNKRMDVFLSVILSLPLSLCPCDLEERGALLSLAVRAGQDWA